jgi:hypothetical protein
LDHKRPLVKNPRGDGNKNKHVRDNFWFDYRKINQKIPSGKMLMRDAIRMSLPKDLVDYNWFEDTFAYDAIVLPPHMQGGTIDEDEMVGEYIIPALDALIASEDFLHEVYRHRQVILDYVTEAKNAKIAFMAKMEDAIIPAMNKIVADTFTYYSGNKAKDALRHFDK